MSMLSEGSPQRVYGKGKRVVEHSNYHCRRHSTDFKRTKIEAGKLPQTGVEISRNAKVDSNVVVQAETSRIVKLNYATSEQRMPPMRQGKPKDLQQTVTQKNVKVVGNEAKSDKMTARDAFHASDKSKTSSHPKSFASSHSLSKDRKDVSVYRVFPQGFEGLDLPPAKSGVLTNRVSQLEPKSLHGALKISDKQDFSSSGRKMYKNDSSDIAAKDQNKLKQVSRDETCKVAQRKTSFEYRRKLEDDEDELRLRFSSPKWQNGDRAENFSEKMSGSRGVSCSFKSSFEANAMAKHQGKSVTEPTEAQQKSKKSAFITKSAGSGIPKLNLELVVVGTPQSTHLSNIPSDECQEGSRDKVHKALKQFKELFTQLMEEREREPKEQRKGTYRADLKAANILRQRGQWINCYPYVGNVPGVKIGDTFQYRVELAIIGLHREYICGIHYEEIDGKKYATSIVDSGRYDNQEISTDEFYYMGEGGNPEVSSGLKDQTLDGGNLALKNSMDSKIPVRVIRGRQTFGASNTMGINTGSGFTFFYDGLFKVIECHYYQDPESGKNVFKFRMKRVTNDPNLTQQASCKPRKSAIQRKQLMIDDMHRQKEKDMRRQKEKMPNSALKVVKTSKFTYNSKPKDFGYKTVHSSARHSSFALRNKDEIFDYEAAALLAKPVVSNRRPYANRATTMLKLG